MKKSILITVYDMEIGGIERSLINMLEHFDYNSYDVDLLIYEHKGELLSFIPKEVNVLPEIKAYSVFRKPIKQCIKEGQLLTSFMRILSKFVSKHKANKRKLEEGPAYIQMQLALNYSMLFIPKLKKEYYVAISYAWPHNIVAHKVKAKNKIAWIHTDYSKLEVDRDIDFKCWNRFDSIASISDDVTTSFLKAYPLLKGKLFKMENINSPSFINKMANQQVMFPYATNETFKLVSVGRLSYAKGFDIAIKALKNLHEKGLNKIKWYVVGYGPEETRLKKEIEKYEMEDSFILLGKQNNPYPFIDGADLYVQPSRYEGKAVTVTEAKILGKPILLTNYATSKSQVTHEEDGIISELSTEGLIRAIEILYREDGLRTRLSRACQLMNFNNQHELNRLYELMGEVKEEGEKKRLSL